MAFEIACDEKNFQLPDLRAASGKLKGQGILILLFRLLAKLPRLGS
jgi:hypothetical protein